MKQVQLEANGVAYNVIAETEDYYILDGHPTNWGTDADQAQAKFFADELKKHGHNKKKLTEELHAYDVHHAGKHIDTIFYGSHEEPESVKKSLVDHDGYHPNITVKKQRNKKKSVEEEVQPRVTLAAVRRLLSGD